MTGWFRSIFGISKRTAQLEADRIRAFASSLSNHDAETLAMRIVSNTGGPFTRSSAPSTVDANLVSQLSPATQRWFARFPSVNDNTYGWTISVGLLKPATLLSGYILIGECLTYSSEIGVKPAEDTVYESEWGEVQSPTTAPSIAHFVVVSAGILFDIWPGGTRADLLGGP